MFGLLNHSCVPFLRSIDAVTTGQEFVSIVIKGLEDASGITHYKLIYEMFTLVRTFKDSFDLNIGKEYITLLFLYSTLVEFV